MEPATYWRLTGVVELWRKELDDYERPDTGVWPANEH
jgi:hypothetical protein